MAVEENSNVTVDTVEAIPNHEKQSPISAGDGGREVAASNGVVDHEEQKSNVEPDHMAAGAGPEKENPLSNGDGKQEIIEAAKEDDVAAEENQSNSTLDNSEADQNEIQPSNGDEKREVNTGEDNVAESSSGSRTEEQAETEDIQEKGKETTSEIEKSEEEKEEQPSKDDVSSEYPTVLASSSSREASDYLCNLKEVEKKALNDLRATVQEAILENRLIKDSKVQTAVGNDDKENTAGTVDESEQDNSGKTNESSTPKNGDAIKLWGVPFCARKDDDQIDTILLMFLRAREFVVSDAFEMLRNTLKWRKDNNIDSILSEDLGAEFDSISYMIGKDREGNPICYNVMGALADLDLYDKALGTPEKRERLVRWRIQLMEKAVQELDFKPGGVTSLLQVTDLKDMPAPSKKDFRVAIRETLETLQDNYPEFVSKNVFINVPFWYYAFSALLSPFLSQRTKNKFVFARPNKVIETLFKYIAPERLPLQYGGLFRENDTEFTTDDATIEISIKAASAANIEIPAPEAGGKIMWDVFVLGWDVNYKEEFVPTDEGSYTLIVQRPRKVGALEGPIRNSFRNSEAGKIVLTVENGLFKKKSLIYRYKIENACSS